MAEFGSPVSPRTRSLLTDDHRAHGSRASESRVAMGATVHEQDRKPGKRVTDQAALC